MSGWKSLGISRIPWRVSGFTGFPSSILGMVQKGDSHLLPKRPEGCFAQKVAVTFLNHFTSSSRRIWPSWSAKLALQPMPGSVAALPLPEIVVPVFVARIRAACSHSTGPGTSDPAGNRIRQEGQPKGGNDNEQKSANQRVCVRILLSISDYS
jgi:hypothetical protein